MTTRKTKNDKLLQLIFEELREQGVHTYQAVADCMTCTWSIIGQEFPDGQNDKGEDVNIAFYHDQDIESFYKDNKIHIGYSPLETGDLIVSAASKYGVKTEWNGDICMRVRLIFEPGG